MSGKVEAQVAFQENVHSPANLQRVSRTDKAARSFFQENPGRNFIFQENAGQREEYANYAKKIFSEEGFLRAYVTGQLMGVAHGEPDPYDVHRVLRAKNLPPEQALKDQLIPDNDISLFLEFGSFDDLRKDFDFTYDEERQSPSISERVWHLTAQRKELISLAYEHWMERDLEKAVSVERRGEELGTVVQKIRDKENVEFLQDRIRRLTRGDSPANLLILMGGAHRVILDALRVRLHSFPVVFSSDTTVYDQTALSKVRTLMLAGESPSDEEVAREVAERVLTDVLTTRALTHPFNTEYLYHWEEITTQYSKVIMALSLSDIEILCKEGANLIEVLKS